MYSCGLRSAWKYYQWGFDKRTLASMFHETNIEVRWNKSSGPYRVWKKVRAAEVEPARE